MECVQHSNMKQQMCLEEQHCHMLQHNVTNEFYSYLHLTMFE